MPIVTEASQMEGKHGKENRTPDAGLVSGALWGIYIDADACPVTRIAERVAKEHGIPVVLLCDTNHVLTSDYSTIKVIGAGADAVDIALIIWRRSHEGVRSTI